MLVFPQSPQLLEIVPKRCAVFSLNFAPGRRLTVTIFSRRVEIFESS